MLIGTPSAKRYTKASKEKARGELCDAYKEMSTAVGVKKPQEAQKAKAFLENEGSQGCGRRILRSRASVFLLKCALPPAWRGDLGANLSG